MNLLKGGDIDDSTIANNPQDINDQIACKFLRRQIIGRNTLYEGNIRKTSVSPGELIEPGYNTEASTRNIAREAQNINDENDHTTTRKSPMEPAGTSPSTELHHLRDSRVDSMTNSLQNINDETSRITTSMESADATPSASSGETGRYNTATLAGYNGEVSLKSAYKKPLANSLADVERNVVSDESAQITPNEDARLAPNNRSIEVADRQLADNFTGSTTDDSVANNSRNVNEGNVLAYDISGIRKSTGRGLDGSAISADALDQSIDNSSIPNNPQDVNDENNHITSSWIQQRRVHTP